MTDREALELFNSLNDEDQIAVIELLKALSSPE